MHEPDESVHVAEGGKVTLPVPLCVNATVPVGDDPVTVTVHAVDEPTKKEEGEQTRDVDVVARGVAATTVRMMVGDTEGPYWDSQVTCPRQPPP
jgi:hypothetical protein